MDDSLTHPFSILPPQDSHEAVCERHGEMEKFSPGVQDEDGLLGPCGALYILEDGFDAYFCSECCIQTVRSTGHEPKESAEEIAAWLIAIDSSEHLRRVM